MLILKFEDGLRFKKNEGKYKTNFNDTNDWFPNLMEFFNISSRRGDFDFISKSKGTLNYNSYLLVEEIVLEINRLVKYQTMEGFGGAFTDSASIHFVNMTKNVQKNLIMLVINTLL